MISLSVCRNRSHLGDLVTPSEVDNQWIGSAGVCSLASLFAPQGSQDRGLVQQDQLSCWDLAIPLELESCGMLALDVVEGGQSRIDRRVS